MERERERDGKREIMMEREEKWKEGKQKMGETLIRRGMNEETLNGAKSTRYKHAARHLLECAPRAPGIQDFGDGEMHESFVDRLRAKHGRKTGFWGQLTEAPGGGLR